MCLPINDSKESFIWHTSIKGGTVRYLQERETW